MRQNFKYFAQVEKAETQPFLPVFTWQWTRKPHLERETRNASLIRSLEYRYLRTVIFTKVCKLHQLGHEVKILLAVITKVLSLVVRISAIEKSEVPRKFAKRF